MTTFAHTETGVALDPQIDDSAESYLKRFAVDATVKWTVEEVPDETEHGAKTDGNGGWVNPAVLKPADPVVSPPTTKQQILDQISALQALANKLP